MLTIGCFLQMEDLHLLSLKHKVCYDNIACRMKKKENLIDKKMNGTKRQAKKTVIERDDSHIRRNKVYLAQAQILATIAH